MKNRIIGMLMAFVLLLTSAVMPVGTFTGMTVQAEEGTNLFKNGDLAIDPTTDDTQGWNLFGGPTYASEKNTSNPCLKFKPAAASADYTNAVYQTVSGLEDGKYYEVSFDLYTDIAREVLVMPDGNRVASNLVSVKKGFHTVKAGFEYTTGLSSSIMICFGQLVTIDGAEHKMFQDGESGSNIRISNIAMREGSPAGQDAAGNLLKNGIFKNNADWDFATVKNVTANVSNHYAVFSNINGTQNADQIALSQGNIMVEKDADYDVSFVVNSGIKRSVLLVVGGKARRFDLARDTDTKISTSYHSSEKQKVEVSLLLGAVIGDSYELDNTGSLHTGTIHEVKIRNAVMIRNDQSGSKLSAAETVKATPSNMLANGNFADGLEDWSAVTANSSIYRPDGADEKYRTTFQIAANTGNDYDIRLQQSGISLTANHGYKISFDIYSDIARKVTVGFEGMDRIGSKTINAGNNTVSFEYAPTIDVNGTFAIYLGKDYDGAHVAAISNVVLLPASSSQFEDDPNDPLPKQITDLTSIKTPEMGTVLQNGDFGYNLEYWNRYQEDWMWQWDTVKVTKPDSGEGIHIKYGDPGTSPDAIKIFQDIKLYKGLQYVLSFDVASGKGRNFQVRLDGLRENFVKTIAVDAKSTRHVSYNIPVQIADKKATFNVLMGKLQNTPGDDFLEFSNMKIEVYGYENLALLVQRGELLDCQSIHYIPDGNFTDGIGRFQVKAAKSYNTDNKYLKIETDLSSASGVNQTSVTREGLNLFKGKKYNISFYGGADPYRNGTVTLKQGGKELFSKEFKMTYSTENYTFSFTPDKDLSNVELAINFNYAAGDIYLDSIRMDMEGYLEARKSVAAKGHDIQLDEETKPPVISEQPLSNSQFGNDITLTYENTSEAQQFINNIRSIAVTRTEGELTGNGYVIKNASKTVEAVHSARYAGVNAVMKEIPGRITIPFSIFEDLRDKSANAPEEQNFKIEIIAPLYEKVTLNQKLYIDKKWKLEWQDEFNGTTLSMSKWSIQEGTGIEYGVEGWGNNEQQLYTSPSYNKDAKYPQDEENPNLELKDGALVISAHAARDREVQVKDANGNVKATTNYEELTGKKYTSARIWTMNEDGTSPLYAQTYGKIEAKIKLPAGQGYEGIWPAFWMLPVDTKYGGWPLSGEIDIMEARGRQPNIADGTIHYGQAWPNNMAAGGNMVWAEDDDAITDFHIYDIEWEPGEIRWYVDGVLYYTANNWYSKSSSDPSNYTFPAPFDQRFYIILNMAIGGSYDVNRVPSDDVLDDCQMIVDYVRTYTATDQSVYQKKAEPVVIGKEKIPSGVKKQDKNGNYMTDSKFKKVVVKKDNKTEASKNGWTFATLPEFGGAANIKVKNGEANIDISNAGNATHSIQLMQNLPLTKGRFYEISFDAKADNVRDLTVKVGDDGTGDNKGNNVWASYGILDTSLSKDLEHYSYVFQMTKDTNSTSRMEFNMGGSTTNLTLKNIQLKEVADGNGDTNGKKRPMADGNCIYNGEFNVGGTSRMTYWNLATSLKSKTGLKNRTRIVKTTTNGDYAYGSVITGVEADDEYALEVEPKEKEKISVYQVGNQLKKGKKYDITFDAVSAGKSKVRVLITSRNNKKQYLSETLDLSSADTNTSRKISFKMSKPTDINCRVQFIVSGDKVTLKDVSMAYPEESQNAEGVSKYPIINGDFELGTSNWSTYGETTLSVTQDPDRNNHKKVLKAYTTYKGNSWDKMLIYENINLGAGLTYELSFDAKTDVNNPIANIHLEDTNYQSTFTKDGIKLSKQWQHYSYDFTANGGTFALKFLLGANVSDWNLYLDNVVLRVKGSRKYAAAIETKYNYGYIGEDVVLTYHGTDTWHDSRTLSVVINGKEVAARNYTWDKAAQTITLNSALFEKPSVYSIVIRDDAQEYEDTNILNYKMISLEGNNAFANTTFDDDFSGWEFWAMNDCAEFTSTRGSVDIYNKFKGGDETWTVQLKQANCPVEPGQEYELSFVGASTLNRDIMIEGADYQTVSLTSEPKRHTVRFTPSAYNLTINFLMGNVNDAPTAAHHITLSDFRLSAVDGKSSVTRQKASEDKNHPTVLHRPSVVVTPASNGKYIMVKITKAPTAPANVKYTVKLTGQKARTVSNISNTIKIPVKKAGTYKYTVKATVPGNKGFADSRAVSGKVKVTRKKNK